MWNGNVSKCKLTKVRLEKYPAIKIPYAFEKWDPMDFIIVRKPDTMGLENLRLTVSNKPELWTTLLFECKPLGFPWKNLLITYK